MTVHEHASPSSPRRPPKSRWLLLGKRHKLYTERHEHDFRIGLAERLAAALARVYGEEQDDPAYHGRRDPPRGTRNAAPKGKRARSMGPPAV
jgi:hypothetical protein